MKSIIILVILVIVLSSSFAYECSEDSLQEYAEDKYPEYSIKVSSGRTIQMYSEDVFTTEIHLFEGDQKYRELDGYVVCTTGEAFEGRPSYTEVTGIPLQPDKISDDLWTYFKTNEEADVLLELDYEDSFEDHIAQFKKLGMKSLSYSLIGHTDCEEVDELLGDDSDCRLKKGSYIVLGVVSKELAIDLAEISYVRSMGLDTFTKKTITARDNIFARETKTPSSREIETTTESASSSLIPVFIIILLLVTVIAATYFVTQKMPKK